MKDWKRKILSPEDEKRIEERIHEFESRADAELVIAIHRASSDYRAAGLRFALFFVCLLLVLSPLLSHALSFKLVLPLVVIALVLGLALGRASAFSVMFMRASEVRKAVRDRALKYFHFYHVHETQHRRGCFFFVSVRERRFMVLVDRALSGLIPQQSLEPLVKELTGHFKDGRHAEGLLNAIAHLEKKVLEHPLPGKAASSNELRDRIRWSGQY